MTVMAETTGSDSHGIVPDRPFTVDDLEEMPDDGRRYELVDGQLVVSPAPGRKHQRVVLKLGALLDAACPAEWEVILAPFTVRTSENNEVQPDVLVARDEDLTETNLPVAPVLAIEVLSPSTGLYDFNLKKAAYQRMGVPDYWVIDPLGPSMIAFRLGEAGNYVTLAEVKDTDPFEAERPFPVRVVPAELLGRLAD